ncbi:uncharacterized protein LOC121511172 isoform X2 [Cheilinus undulatus]|uniref:uncharacterized protein LOC121511172 isoform X2 n=1 Tax=Cheilinus undulatus TaxID=241271 RepID=UPI001BD21424|nr:uncharacterized protein LOC121511172 isoform X2 [Cheilinus undulatus]
MKDGVRLGENTDISRQEVFEHYANIFLPHCSEVGPCRDERLLEKAAQFLQREPDLSETFTVFPFNQSLSEGCGGLAEDCRKFLCSFIKATELLETLCVNLVLQPWKKEIKTLKTFTGPFVYRLRPVFSSSNIQSVLASIGYLPHTAPLLSEYRLSEDANPDRAMLVGFELLLARVECNRLLELHDREQMGQQAPLHLDSRLAVKPQPKPRHYRIKNEDQSIMEMQMNYPDLVFRGRPLLADKPHRANSRSSVKAAHTSNITTDESKAADLPRRDSVKSPRAAAQTESYDEWRVDDVFVHDVKHSGYTGRNRGQTADSGVSVSRLSNSDGGKADNEHLHGSTAEQSLNPGESAAEAPTWTQQAAADPPSLSSKNRDEDVREHEGSNQFSSRARQKKPRGLSGRKVRVEGNVVETGPISHVAAGCSSSSEPDPDAMTAQKKSSMCTPSLLTISAADLQSNQGGNKEQRREDAERTEASRGEGELLDQSYVVL